MITFRDRKNKAEINCSFSVRGDSALTSASLGEYLVGDRVTLLTDIKTEYAHLLNYSGVDSVHACDLSGKDEWQISIPFCIVDRYHGLSFSGEVGILQELGGTSLCLEAESGVWEDVFLWLVEGTQPDWVDE
jgi:hypothetical protein